MLEQSDFMQPVEYTVEEASDLVPLEPLDQAILAAVEQSWYTKKKLLTSKDMSSITKLSQTKVAEIYAKPSFQHALRTKGLVSDQIFNGILTDKQVNTVNVVTNRHDVRSFREKLKECKVTVSQWGGWMSERTFYDYVQKRSGVNFNSADHTFFNIILTSMEEGDLAATKMYGEMRGLYQNKTVVDINFNQFVNQILEVVMDYVPEDKIEEMADRIESLQKNFAGSPNVLSAAPPMAIAI